jgi:hypothetical protein
MAVVDGLTSMAMRPVDYAVVRQLVIDSTEKPGLRRSELGAPT